MGFDPIQYKTTTRQQGEDAAEAGGQTLAAAHRTGPGGSVVATDISPTILTGA